MGELISIPRLDGGIGQQPPSQRPSNQVATCQNFLPSVAEGLVKRYGSELVCEVATADPNSISPPLSGTAYRLHAIERDGDERYLLIYGDSTIRIFDTEGNESTITDQSSGAAETYLDSNSASADDLRARTFADTTFLINKTVTLAAEVSDDYEVRRVFPNPSAVYSFTASANAYMRAESDDDVDQAGYFQYTLSGDTSLKYGRIDFPIITNEWSQPNAGRWDDTGGTYQPCGFTISYSRRRLTGFTGATWTTATNTLTKTGAFASYSFKNGDHIYITAGTGWTAGWYEITSRTSDDAIVVSGGPGADNADTAANDSDSKCRIGNEIEIGVDMSAETVTTMADIAAVFQRELRNAGAINACCCWVPAEGGGGQFQITAPYRSDHSKLYAPTAPTVTGVVNVTDTSGEPFYVGGSGHTITAGTGTLGANADTRPPESRWTKVAAPLQPDAAPDPTTMPITLVRTAADAFDLNLSTWDSRLDGDEFTNPIPDMFDGTNTLADIALHRNRFVLLAGEHLLFTRTNDLYDVFIEDTAEIADDDPIAVTIGGDSAVRGSSLAAFRKALKVFTESAVQFDVGTPESLTPTTVQVTIAGRVRTIDTEPGLTGNRLYFLASADDATALMEARYDDLAISLEPQNVSEHVPQLLSSTAKRIVSHEASGLTFVLPAVGDSIDVYRTSFLDQSRRQSAWTTIDFDNTIQIIDIAVLGDYLYLFTTAAGYEYVIERISLGREDAGTAPFTAHLDRREVLTGTLIGGTETEFTLSVAAQGSTINTYVEEDGTWGIADGNWKYGTAGGASTDDDIRIPGDLTGQSIILGRYFQSEFTLSRPYLRDERGQASLGDRLNIIEAVFSYLEAGEFDVVITETNFATRTVSFSATGTTDEEGEFPVYIQSELRTATVKVQDDSPKPLKITGVQFDADPSPMAVR